MLPTLLRQRTGKPESMAPAGRLTAMSGAAAAMRISCSIIWAAKSRPPSDAEGR